MTKQRRANISPPLVIDKDKSEILNIVGDVVSGKSRLVIAIDCAPLL